MGATRRRGAVLEDAIQQAVRAELAEHGYNGTTYEGVAARAGTSKPVLYRRWSSKAEMVAAASVRAAVARVEPPDTGHLAGDLRALLRQGRSIISTIDRPTLLALMADLDPDAAESLRVLRLDEGAQILLPIIERAQRRGELGPKPLPDRVLQLPFDLVRHEQMTIGSPSDEVLDAMVDQVLLPLFSAIADDAKR